MPKRKGITHKIVTIVFNISSVEDYALHFRAVEVWHLHAYWGTDIGGVADYVARLAYLHGVAGDVVGEIGRAHV